MSQSHEGFRGSIAELLGRYTSFFDLKFGMIKLGVFDWNVCHI